MKLIIIAVISTLIIGFIGFFVGPELLGDDVLEIGPIFAIATMGGFILYAIKKANRDN